MPSSCKDIRAALVACLQSSPCVLIDRNLPADCLRHPLVETLPTQCQQLKRGYSECRRGMIDMRKRFRGNSPISVSQELEGGGGKGQLYAGRAAVGEIKGGKEEEEEQNRDEEEGG